MPPPPVQHSIEQIDTAAVELPLPPAPIIEPVAPPDVDGSDPLIAQALQAVLASPGLQDVLITDGFVRRLVVVDNLPREQVLAKRSPLRPAPGPFEVDEKAGGRVIAARNAARYEPYVKMAEGVDIRRLSPPTCASTLCFRGHMKTWGARSTISTLVSSRSSTT